MLPRSLVASRGRGVAEYDTNVTSGGLPFSPLEDLDPVGQ